MTLPRNVRGRSAQLRGLASEAACCAALVADGWTIHGRRLRTAAGELDIVAERAGVLAIVEVKQRARLAGAAESLSPRQRVRLLGAAEILLAANPAWGCNGVRFDLMVVDGQGAIRRIADAFRLE